ncbi:MAG: prolyl oligopeptidase family serine peptidase [Armatimonadota bacterium]|nr:prolyl oligopeptidase family serine peptidase [Armatimonadota bacterium]
MPIPTLFLATAILSGPAVDTGLTLEGLFPDKSPFGKAARDMAWSDDDDFVAYLWNPYDDKGSDLWLYDVKQGKARRVSDIRKMSTFDSELKEVAMRYERDLREEKRRETLTEEERKKLKEKDEEDAKKRTEPLKEYAGVAEIEWANNKREMLFTFDGDIFRYDVQKDEIERLTKTLDRESGLKWTKDDSGFFFRRGSGVYRMTFGKVYVEQLNPSLPNGLPMQSYYISPDETKLAITSSRETKPPGKVTYITYRGRFAEAKTADRSTATDPFTSDSHLFLYDIGDEKNRKPWQVWHWPAGEEYGQLSLAATPWSPDSKKMVFSTWKRTQKDVDILVADLATRKVEPVFSVKHMGGSNSPGMADPMFTKDGTRIVALLETSGFRHLWSIDPLTKGGTQLTRGDFEVYPVELTEDGKSIVARSWKEHSSRMDIYRVNLTDGAMTRLSRETGQYSTPAMSHNSKHYATNFESWNALRELIIFNGHEATVTSSHAPKAKEFYVLKPQVIEYKNRHGHMIRGRIYYPPGFTKADKRPLLVYVYGGPLGTSKDVVDGSHDRFGMYVAQNLGYVSVTIDPRGMSGYGALFESANYNNPGVPQTEDLVDGVKYLIAQGGIDAEKVGIHGWSFGGFQTQMCLYTAPETFKLGIAGAGPTEWQNYNNWYSGGVIGDTRVGKPEDLDKYSLTKLAKNLKGNLMLLHGMEDTNVLFQDTIKVYQELLKSGKGPLVELVIDPTGGHGMGGDIKTKERYAIYEGYLRRMWGPYVAPGKN